MTRRNVRFLVTIACALLLSCSEATEEDSPHAGMDQLERQLELHHHKDLLARQALEAMGIAFLSMDNSAIVQPSIAKTLHEDNHLCSSADNGIEQLIYHMVAMGQLLSILNDIQDTAVILGTLKRDYSNN